MKTTESLTCRFCANYLPETQEHLDICDGTRLERRGARISEVMGRVILWRWMTQKITQKMTHKTVTVTSIPDAPCGVAVLNRANLARSEL